MATPWGTAEVNSTKRLQATESEVVMCRPFSDLLNGLDLVPDTL